MRARCGGSHLSLGQDGWRQLTGSQLMAGEQVTPKATHCKNVPSHRHITEDLHFHPTACRWAKPGSWCRATHIQLCFLFLLTCILTNLFTYKKKYWCSEESDKTLWKVHNKQYFYHFIKWFIKRCFCSFLSIQEVSEVDKGKGWKLPESILVFL